MAVVTVIYGEQSCRVEVAEGSLVGEAVTQTGLLLEQPCAGRGTCGKCKVLIEAGGSAPDDAERHHLTPGELALGQRLACWARVVGDAQVALAPVVVYSNKIFHASNRYRQSAGPLGLAIDLGSTTVAAFLTVLDTGEVCAGGAALNQQSVYGADVISRLAAARGDPQHAGRLQRLALASINQAVDALNLSTRVRKRIQRVTVVGNVAMHHLLAHLPVETLAVRPFQPVTRQAQRDATGMLGGIFPEGVQVMLPPLIGGFVGSDALACLAYFGFERATAPMAAIDLGTNGEVLVTDGQHILAASTAAGPAFEGVLISCGTRAVDGAITQACFLDGELSFTTIGDAPPVGLTGSGLLSLVYELCCVGVIEPGGRISPKPPELSQAIESTVHGRRIHFAPEGDLGLTQWDVRELQKAKGAIRAAMDTLMARLSLRPGDIRRLILTGSFGGQVDITAALGLGMIPPVRREVVETIANGAGLGAAMFLSDDGFNLGERLAQRAEQVDLDQDAGFTQRYISAMRLDAS